MSLNRLVAVGLAALLGTACAISEMATVSAPTRMTGHHVSRMSLYEGHLYFGAGYCLHRLNIQDRVLEQILCTQDWTFQRPAVDGERAYVQVLTSPKAEQFFVAIDLSTSAVVWSVDESKGIGPYLRWMKDNTVLIDGRVITVRGERFTSEQRIYAFDARTGRQVWRTGRSDMASANPLFIYDALAWYVIDQEGSAAKNGTLVAVDPITGKAQETLDLRPDTRFDQLLYVDDERAFGVGSLGSPSVRYVFAASRTASQVVWSSQLVLPSGASQAILYDSLFAFESNDTVYALDVDTGQVIWQFDPGTEQGITGDPEHVVLFVLGASVDRSRVYRLYALDVTSGEMIWSYPLYDFAEPVVRDGVAYIGNRYTIDALDLRTGDVLWQVNIDSEYEYDFDPL